MKKKTIVISIIVIQFVLIICLSIFSLLKVVEAHKEREWAVADRKRSLEYEIQAHDREVLFIEQIKSYSIELEKCQGKK